MGRRIRGANGVVAMLAGVVIASPIACQAGPPAPSASASPGLPYGTAIEAGPNPDPVACRDRVAREVAGAIRIRASLDVPEVAATEVGARFAAADPTADTASLGIPVTAAELAAVRRSGLAIEAIGPIANWVSVGAPERFGGLWLNGGATIVAVVDGDSETLALARCVEPPGTHYVFANVSLAAGEAIKDRIAADMPRWRASGLAINLVDYDETTGVVNVGVTTPTPEALHALQAEYGPLIRLQEAGPVQPA